MSILNMILAQVPAAEQMTQQAADTLQQAVDTAAQVVTDSVAALAAATAPVAEAAEPIGGWWIMIPLALLAVVSIYIFFERLFAINHANRQDRSFMDRIKEYIHRGEVDQALKLCQDTNTPYSRMIEKGVTRIGRPMNDVLVAIENVGNMEVAKLEKGFTWLATTAAGAPMIGFLGTVIGMVQAFFQLASAGNNSNVTILASGIYQALVTTVAGLIVGILALFAYNFLTSRVNKVMNKLEGKTMEFMDLLNEPAK